MGDNRTKPFAVRNSAKVIAKAKLIKIPLHILTADMVVYAVYHTFAVVAPKAFYRIGICVTDNVLALPVVNYLGLIDFPHYTVAVPLVSKERSGTFYRPKYRSC